MSQLEIDHDEPTPTRSERRRQARAARIALERARVERDLRRRRLALLAAIGGLAATAIAAIVIATGQGAQPAKVTPRSAEATAVRAQVSGTLSGVPQHGNVLGSTSARVTLQYYGDLQCPVCRDFTVNVLPSLTSRWVREGRLKIEYRSLETATREPEVFVDQQVAALAAGEQNRMWNFLETFYGEQQEEGTGYVTEEFIRGIAAQVPGLSAARWSAARGDVTLAEAVEADAQAAAAARLNGTPAFLIASRGRTARRFSPSSFADPRSFDTAIEASLAS